jgi:hypothetical protein
MFREFGKHLKKTPKCHFFVNYSDETEKEINYRSLDVFFKYLHSPVFTSTRKNKD